MMELTELIKIGKNPGSGLASVKVALVGDTSTQFLAMALRGSLVKRGLNPSLFEADYDQVELQVFNPASDLYSHCPEYVVLYQSAEKFSRAHYDAPTDQRAQSAEKRLAQIRAMLARLTDSPERKIIIFNYADINDRIFGNFSNSVVQSLPHQLRLLNLGLSELAAASPNVFVLDLAAEQSRVGRKHLFDARQYAMSANALSVDATAPVSENCADIIAASKGIFAKCVVLDLDNTLWGGAIGDDGLENIEIGELGLGRAFSDFQRWLKQLRERGIILAVCSKNDEANARQPFESHPDMILKLDDIAVFVANWESKAENIRHIQKTLNIGFSSMVFLDDNPVEREVVSSSISEIIVPELPQDPSSYLGFLQSLNLFETVSFTRDDAVRTSQYQAEAKRLEIQSSAPTTEAFLESLEMSAVIEGFTEFNLPRVAQLVQRSNQFNLRTIRYSESELADMADDDKRINVAVSLTDRFGSYGLISIVMLLQQSDDEFFIDNWLMSCRVLGRGVEQLVCNEIARVASGRGAVRLIGEFIPTAKNSLVKDHYEKLGFKQLDDRCVMDLRSFEPWKVQVKVDRPSPKG